MKFCLHRAHLFLSLSLRKNQCVIRTLCSIHPDGSSFCKAPMAHVLQVSLIKLSTGCYCICRLRLHWRLRSLSTRSFFSIHPGNSSYRKVPLSCLLVPFIVCPDLAFCYHGGCSKRNRFEPRYLAFLYWCIESWNLEKS